jgi:hypothetical protein
VPLFGSFEAFLILLFHVDQVRNRNISLLQEQLTKMLNLEKLKGEKATQSSLKEFVTTVNKHLREVSVMLLKGCFMSNESYKKLRLIQSFKLDEERGIVLRSTLPKFTNSFLKPLYVL